MASPPSSVTSSSSSAASSPEPRSASAARVRNLKPKPKRNACYNCRHSKAKCIPARDKNVDPETMPYVLVSCTRCRMRNMQCQYPSGPPYIIPSYDHPMCRVLIPLQPAAQPPMIAVSSSSESSRPLGGLLPSTRAPPRDFRPRYGDRTSYPSLALVPTSDDFGLFAPSPLAATIRPSPTSSPPSASPGEIETPTGDFTAQRIDWGALDLAVELGATGPATFDSQAADDWCELMLGHY
ncbi:hypothetical protein MIND_00298000 [Mycena indigotica]|uniref:Zn(2)-C6 fungal-type domain-containing protein n=1 Tax=Mycena indigotica TaxID=2126181 RepID=A0A8H6T2Q1_9AGAR|nr:uncharacterized protein MIND_00298000 [Mycena indigotica]KAF7309277.1 hypothetical protein MIND_00298000 [Mycena indigotica]